jgi:hypothetical protein
MEKETTDYANFVIETKTRVIPTGARNLAETRSLSRNVARDLRDGVRICEVLRRLRGSG